MNIQCKFFFRNHWTLVMVIVLCLFCFQRSSTNDIDCLPAERLKALIRPNTRPLLCSPMHLPISWIRHVRESGRQCASSTIGCYDIREWIYNKQMEWGAVIVVYLLKELFVYLNVRRALNDDVFVRKWRFIQMTINLLLVPERNLNNLYLKNLSGILAMHVYDEDVSPLLPSRPTEFSKWLRTK